MATPILLRYNNDYKFPATDAQFVQYKNTNLNESASIMLQHNTVENVKDALDALDNKTSEIYLVKFTWNESTRKWSCNRTYTEISTAWDANKAICGVALGFQYNSSGIDPGHSGINTVPKFLGCTFYYDGRISYFVFSTVGNIGGNESTYSANDIIYISISNATDNNIVAGTVSFALQNHIHLNYAPKSSPTFTGTPTAPTATVGTSSTQIATTEFVTTANNNIKPLYIHKYASNGQITFDAGQFKGNRVYCCSTNNNTWAAINKITLANGCLEVTTAQGDIYVDCPLGIGQSLPENQGIAIKYTLLFYAAGNITWSIPSDYIKWENGVAPTTAAGDYCILTIFNRIASLQKVNIR